MKPSPKKPKTKKFIGYVPKGETINQSATVDMFTEKELTTVYFQIPESKIVKRTITLSWEDEPVKEKK